MLRLVLFGIALLGVAACSSSGETVTLDLVVTEVPTDGDRFTYYDLFGQEVIDPDSADTSIRWDLAFRGTEVLLNSGTSGPGAAVGTFVDTPFENIDTVGIVGFRFRRDGESECAGGEARAVCAEPGSPFSPYVSDGSSGIATADDRVLVLRTSDGQGYAKVQFTGYVPADPDDPGAGGTVTLEYLVNPRGRLLIPGEEVTL